ncbi:MAG: class I SAM-dependent methyltransferase [Candidatus Eremiobacterota bacterium]
MGMLADRLRKNLRHLQKWARRSQVSCFRVYDRDIPQHPVTVDTYEGRVVAFCGQRTELSEVGRELGEVFGVEPVLKERRPGGQYPREGRSSEEFPVSEGGLKFLVNLRDYHDTGLFLDHRLTRAMVRDLSSGRRVLNLFCYTGSFSVYAAAGGAASTTSVDLSRTYLAWARRNLELNGFPNQELVYADVMQWLRQARHNYDLIVCDPPTFSNSKKMQGWLDLQEHHPQMIRLCLDRLSPEGLLLFSTNDQRFTLRELPGCQVEDITRQTLPEDFRNRQPHRCFRIRALRGDAAPGR